MKTIKWIFLVKRWGILSLLVVGLIISAAPARPAEAFIGVEVDIKPGSDPNGINSNAKGLVAVAILSSVTFYATAVNADTLAFGPNSISPVHSGHLEDVNQDGIADYVSHYRQNEIGLVSSDTEACLSGYTYDGQHFYGCDSVKVK